MTSNGRYWRFTESVETPATENNLLITFWNSKMKFKAQNGDSFELKILGYQYPSEAQYYWDLNWLTIQVNATIAGKSWTATDSSILTREIPELVEWLQNMHYGHDTQRHCRFLEPTLVFMRKKYRKVTAIRVYLDYELLPDWLKDKKNKESVFVQFPVDQIDLLEAAEYLRSQLNKYPERHEVLADHH